MSARDIRRLSELLDQYDVVLIEERERVAVRVALVFLSEAETLEGMVERVTVLNRSMNELAGIDRALKGGT